MYATRSFGLVASRVALSTSAAFLVSLVLSLWLLLFILSRIHMLPISYSAQSQKREDERWLLQQCDIHEFYHNMKQHSSLCDDLSVTSRSSLLLGAVQHVVDHTYLCGYTPCHELLDATISWLLGKGLAVTALVALALLLFPTLFVPILRSNMNHLADRRMHQLYNAPYGTIHYGKSHPWGGEDEDAGAHTHRL
jgi:hypothetical protein